MKRKVILFSLVAVTAIGFMGCASDDANNDSHKRSAGRYIDDKVLVQRVKSSLNDNEVYKFPDVKVNTYNGTVQLTGFVNSEEQKRKAEEIVRNVRGVANVQNQIMMKSDSERVRGTTDRNDVNRDLNTNTNTAPRNP
jgi:hyperosmotically inducible periplasmic protein